MISQSSGNHTIKKYKLKNKSCSVRNSQVLLAWPCKQNKGWRMNSQIYIIICDIRVKATQWTYIYALFIKMEHVHWCFTYTRRRVSVSFHVHTHTHGANKQPDQKIQQHEGLLKRKFNAQKRKAEHPGICGAHTGHIGKVNKIKWDLTRAWMLLQIIKRAPLESGFRRRVWNINSPGAHTQQLSSFAEWNLFRAASDH